MTTPVAHPPAARQLSVPEATIALLRDLKMTTSFGNPGSTELPLILDFPSDFRYVPGLQESVVVGMADGYAQATRNAAFLNVSVSSVQKWESPVADEHPSGAAAKLLRLAETRGVEALIA